MSDYAEKMLKYGFQFRKVQLILDGTWFEKQTWLLFQFRKVQLIRLHLRCVSSRKEVSIPQGPINTGVDFGNQLSLIMFQFRKVQLIQDG